MHNKVIACIDDSQYAESVCDYAAWSAQRMSAPLSLLHVLDQPHGGDDKRNLSGAIGLGSQEALLQELAELDERRAKLSLEHGKHMLKAARARAEGQGAEGVETRQRHGDLVSTIANMEPETRMLVVGKRGADNTSAHGHIGSHLEGIIRTMHKPILVAQQSFAPPEKIMIAFDGSATMKKGVDRVAASPLFKGIPCHLVMVGPDVEASREPLKAAQKVLEDAGFEVSATIVPGDPETALPQYQEENDIDLLILGAYGHSRIRHFFVGSTTTSVLSKTRTSMMILR
ncbi:universal stress protein [Marinimicrobium alkaliphilum]|uniref:universal stress protein n=1 Tax=Marinimicrobium alkaliphilum TaxID=2202654 RepID=UPI000DB99D45|nr:universal stress protein [Marinimicrobium alkaliphilum]